ncbi:DUF5808 domain-containing protein [Paenibacillus macerans]|uniref:DUF1648 domain-containing protein n=1 Tax=Paenibacillus macerans TaxID=44252 RepID=UPI002E1AFA50|nr:DUF5808 domain-containing protein [Paenibacillus macerans]
MQWMSALMLILMFVPLLASLAFMPYLTRETVSFGVSVSEEQYRSEPLRRMRKQYAVLSCAIYTALLLFCIAGMLSVEGNGQGGVFAIFVTVTIVVSILLNISFYFRMKKIRPTLPSVQAHKALLAVDTGFHRQKLTFSGRWFLIHVLIIAVSAAIMLMNYEAVPDPVAMKFDFAGNVVSSAAKSYRVVLFPSVMQAIMTLLFWFVNWSIQKSKQQIHAGNPEQSVRQNAAFRRRWSLFTILSSLALVFMFSFIQVNMIHPLDTNIVTLVSLIVPVFTVLFAMVLSFATGQGGSRLGRSAEASAAAPLNDDRYWKLGAFYFNPQDPSVFVEKRSGIGWTLNFANPVGWFVLAGIAAVIIGSSLFFKN